MTAFDACVDGTPIEDELSGYWLQSEVSNNDALKFRSLSALCRARTEVAEVCRKLLPPAF
jgi:hypothetical protein